MTALATPFRSSSSTALRGQSRCAGHVPIRRGSLNVASWLPAENSVDAVMVPAPMLTSPTCPAATPAACHRDRRLPEQRSAAESVRRTQPHNGSHAASRLVREKRCRALNIITPWVIFSRDRAGALHACLSF